MIVYICVCVARGRICMYVCSVCVCVSASARLVYGKILSQERFLRCWLCLHVCVCLYVVCVCVCVCVYTCMHACIWWWEWPSGQKQSTFRYSVKHVLTILFLRVIYIWMFIHSFCHGSFFYITNSFRRWTSYLLISHQPTWTKLFKNSVSLTLFYSFTHSLIHSLQHVD